MCDILTSKGIDELLNISDYEKIDSKSSIERALNEFDIDISKAVDKVVNDMRVNFNLK